MRTILRNSLLLAFFALASLTAQAQFSFGGGAVLGLNANEFGVQARGQYDINETWRGAADFTLYFPGQNISAFEINANAHYKFLDNGEGQVKAYALGGLNFTRFSVDIPDLGFGLPGFDPSYTDVGLNLGAGANLPLGERLMGYAEAKFAVGSSEFGLAAGILF